VIVQGTSVGLDVHALSVVAHAVDEETGKLARARLCPDYGEVSHTPIDSLKQPDVNVLTTRDTRRV